MDPTSRTSAAFPSEYTDPVEVSPSNYRALFENEHVRVLEMGLGRGEIDVPHSHPAETVYFVRGGKLRVHLLGAEAVDLEVPDHSVTWHEAWTHRVENIGTTDVLAIIVESQEAR